jgi:transcriptional regulator with XRE-family HTH domain
MHDGNMDQNLTTPTEIGKRLLALRNALEFSSQAAFAVRVGISAQALSNYEKGFRRPDIDVAISISAKTGATLDWIYQGATAGLPIDLYRKLSDEPTSRIANEA